MVAGRRSGNVAVAAIEWVTKGTRVKCCHDLRNTVGHRHAGLRAQLGTDLVEAHLVSARVLVAVHIGGRAAIDLLADLLDEVKLAGVLTRAPGIEHFARHLLRRRFEHRAYSACRVADMDVWTPELLAEHFQLAGGP